MKSAYNLLSVYELEDKFRRHTTPITHDDNGARYRSSGTGLQDGLLEGVGCIGAHDKGSRRASSRPKTQQK